MRYAHCIAALLLTVTAVAHAGAEDEPALPVFPKIPKGFDEGIPLLLENLEAGDVEVSKIVASMFRDADLHDVVDFLHYHVEPGTIADVDNKLGLKGALKAAKTPQELHRVLKEAEVGPGKAADALGKVLQSRGYTGPEVGAWLYARNINSRAILNGLGGVRSSPHLMRAELRKLATRENHAAALFKRGHWEFDLKDGSETMGGHYSGPQLCTSLLALGWSADDFVAAMDTFGEKGLNKQQRALYEWGDGTLLWESIQSRASERELYEAAYRHFSKGKGGEEIEKLMIATTMERCNAPLRWFRTAGAGIVGVYRGPWPDSKGTPAAPKIEGEKLEEADLEATVSLLTEEVRSYFSQQGDFITIVAYEDGSARAVITRPGRKPEPYPHGSPVGRRESRQALFEGRLRVGGAHALLGAVYHTEVNVFPPEIDLVNLHMIGRGALMACDVDNGYTLIPLLLRRVSPTIALE